MNGRPENRRFPRMAAVAALALVVAVAGGLRLRGDEEPRIAAGEPSPLAKAMIGTWALAGTPDNVVEPQAKGGRLKFLTGAHWAITEADPDTGEVIYHHGGTYTLDGDDYAETITYANKNTAHLIGKTHRFKVKVDGDTFTQVGIGNPWTEAWKRAK